MPWDTYICEDFDARRPRLIFSKIATEKSRNPPRPWFKERDQNSVLIRILCVFSSINYG